MKTDTDTDTGIDMSIADREELYEELEHVVGPFGLCMPEDLLTNDLLDIRSNTVTEDEDMELVNSIKSLGQIQPIEVRRTQDGHLEVVAGHRRVKAISVINMGLADGEAPVQVAYVVHNVTDKEALAHTWAENMNRLNMNPLEQARGIQNIREQFNWNGKANTKHVAAFLTRSVAWVGEREKLLLLPDAAKAHIESGRLSADAALSLPVVAVEKIAEVVEEAERTQAAEESRSVAAGKGGKKGKSASTSMGRVVPVSGRHIRAAARNVPGAVAESDKKPLSRREILDFFEAYRGSIPHGYVVIQDCIEYLLDKYVQGKGSDRTMMSKFDAMIAPACKGERAVVKEEAAKEAPVAVTVVGKDAPKTDKAVKAAKASKADRVVKTAKAPKTDKPKSSTTAKPSKQSKPSKTTKPSKPSSALVG